MSAQESKKLAGPIDFTGPAVDREALVRDKNDGSRPVEASWIAALDEQADSINKSEVAFFEELRRRIPA